VFSKKYFGENKMNCENLSCEEIQSLGSVTIIPKNNKQATVINTMNDTTWGPQIQVMETWNATEDTNAQFTEVSWYKAKDIGFNI
jgi:hypothetical protein